MSEQPPPQDPKPDSKREPRSQRSSMPKDPGFIDSLIVRAELIIRLMFDGRVRLLPKLLPPASVIYILIPDIPGPFDDIAMVWALNGWFLRLCPEEVVAEHLAEIEGTNGEGEESNPRNPNPSNARSSREPSVEGQSREVNGQ